MCSKGLGLVHATCILYFPIAHNTLCLPPKFCINYCFGNVQSSQENLKTIVYAKFGGQTKCIMGNWKIENSIPKEAVMHAKLFENLSNVIFVFETVKKSMQMMTFFSF